MSNPDCLINNRQEQSAMPVDELTPSAPVALYVKPLYLNMPDRVHAEEPLQRGLSMNLVLPQKRFLQGYYPRKVEEAHIRPIAGIGVAHFGNNASKPELPILLGP